MIVEPKYLHTGIVYIAALFGGSVLVDKVLQVFAVGGDDREEGQGTAETSAPYRPGIAGAGALIGIIERLLIISLVALNQFSAVGFVLAAKSIARYKRMEEDPAFAEYYLSGTLTSSAIAAVAGLLVRLFLIRS